jgi:hypothetical protein
LGIAALAIDLPIAMAERRNAQNAADHAALSAAWAHCTSQPPAAAANSSVQSNGYETSQLTLTSPATGVYQAAIASSSGIFFAKIWGSSDVAIGTSSEAECQVTTGTGHAIHAFGDCGDDWGIDFNGSFNTITGGVHTNHMFNISGNENRFDNGQVTFGVVGGIIGGTDNIYVDPPEMPVHDALTDPDDPHLGLSSQAFRLHDDTVLDPIQGDVGG